MFWLKRTPPPKRVLVLETLQQLCKQARLQYFFFCSFDQEKHKADIFGSLVTALGRVVHQAAMDVPEGADIWHLTSSKSKGLDMLSDAKPPSLQSEAAVSLAVEGVTALVGAVSELAQAALDEAKARTATTAAAESKEDDVGAGAGAQRQTQLDIGVCSTMAVALCTPVLSTLSVLLSRGGDDEPQLQHVLMAYQSLANTCGMLGLDRPRDAVLSSLCTYALPARFAQSEETVGDVVRRLVQEAHQGERGSPMLSALNIQALKALFNIAHCLGNMLGSAWLPVLKSFEQLDTIVQVSAELITRINR